MIWEFILAAWLLPYGMLVGFSLSPEIEDGDEGGHRAREEALEQMNEQLSW